MYDTHPKYITTMTEIVNRSFFPIEITSITCSLWIQALNTKKTLRTPKVETCKWKVVVGPGWGRKDLGYTIRWRITKDLTQTRRMDPSNQQTSFSTARICPLSIRLCDDFSIPIPQPPRNHNRWTYLYSNPASDSYTSDLNLHWLETKMFK